MAADELTGLIHYLGQEDWQECFGEVLGDHIGPALEAGDISFDADFSHLRQFRVIL